MDYSSYDYYQQQPQQQQQAAPDPSQIQAAYDQSSQPYYSYAHQFNQSYNYYPPSHDFASTNSYAHQSLSQFQPADEPTTSIHPPGVPVPTQQPIHLQSQQNAYYPPQVTVENPQQVNSVVATMSQLLQLGGNLDTTQRAVHPPIGHSPYRVGGRRGGKPFRGGGRGHFGTRPDGSAPPFRGRGRGQGGGRHFSPQGAAATTSTASTLAEGVAASMQQPSASVSGQASLPVPAQVPAAPFWPPPRMAWCELCRVDCNTLEILEQHKNGKRHKKNLQKHEELQRLNKVITGQQNVQMPNSELQPEVVVQSEKVEENEGKQTPPENLTSEAVTGDNRNETEQQKDVVGNSEVLAEPEKKPKDQFAVQGRGLKRNMRGGRGGKYMRTYEGARRPVKTSKPKQAIPLMCELCNVKCDSQVVFDSHLTGKKHLANLKRFHGHCALYGEIGLQALYPPNLNVPPAHQQAGLQSVYPPNFNAPSTSGNPLVQQQGINDPQVLLAQLLMTYVLSQAQAQPPVMVPAATTLEPPPSTGSALENEYQPGLETQGSGGISEAGIHNADAIEAKVQPQLISRESETSSSVSADADCLD
ncbi:uncharacterized protein LOC122294006 [Carya illinoinensis]|nr:uncharacterized protein LOC122294006 [Carya illinoinensis]